MHTQVPIITNPTNAILIFENEVTIHMRIRYTIQDTGKFILEWTTSLDTSSRTLFVRMWG